MLKNINSHSSKSISPVDLVGGIIKNIQLIYQMTQRDIFNKYKGSMMGVTWSLLHPLFMLIIYTFVFSVIFKSKWNDGSEGGETQFALILFVGMIVHGFFSEILNKSPMLIVSNVNYVKKVVFPLEILSVITLGGAVFNALISLGVLVVATYFVAGSLHWTVLLFPVVIFPLGVLALGFSWILASLGVFLRDIGQITGIITSVMLFLSPVFFPINALPKDFQIWFMLNPLTFIIEQSREVLIWGHFPDWSGLGIYTGASLIVTWLGYVWFQKTRNGFSDVL